MTQIPAIDAKSATYNAVKIQVNDPKTNLTEGFKSSPEDSGIYNAVSIEVNRPSIETNRNTSGIYDYPESQKLVTSDMAPIHPVNIPNLPVFPAYQTNNYINNRTLVNAEFEVKNKFNIPDDKNLNVEEEPNLAPETISDETVSVPEPNLTTTEAEKASESEVSFNGLPDEPQTVEEETLPESEMNIVEPESEADVAFKGLAEEPQTEQEEILPESEKNIVEPESEKVDETEVAFKGLAEEPLTEEGEIIPESEKSVVEPEAENTEEAEVTFKGLAEEPQMEQQEEISDEIDTTTNGLSFKADDTKQPIEIVPPVDIKSEVDIPDVIANLSSPDFDIQAKQMEEIAQASMKDPQKAVPYIVTEVFSGLIDIVKNDTSNLTPPSEKQIETRKQIIINELIKEQAASENKDINSIELPYNISEEDMKEATNLSTMEQAERNKEYALYTMSILDKIYVDEIEKHTGNVVPLTDLPGVSTIVDTLRYDSNSGTKIAAIDALGYINRPEYKEELNSVLTLAANDSNPYVARNAAAALDSLS